VQTTLAVYVNADDALTIWTVDALDPACRGFAIQRRADDGAPTWLDNYAPPGPATHQRGLHQSSAKWPFRRFSWTDHEVPADAAVSYRVVPVLKGPPDETLASAWSAPRTLRGGDGTGYEAHFNRGFLISQFMSRYLDQHYPGVSRDVALRRFKADIGTQLDDTLRVFLSAGLRTTMLELLGNAPELYGALFELADEELLRGLEALGPRAHIVLANGSIDQRKGEPLAQARARDENAAARTRLKAAGVDVSDRFVAPGPLAHNKFLVSTAVDGTPAQVWTGSTNWTPTGLCTQLNNGLLVDDAQVAAVFLAQWHALRDAGSTHPPGLTTANAKPTTVGRATIHFTRAAHKADLAALAEVVAGAKEGVLFLMFMPGGSGVLADVVTLAAAQPDLLLRGVVSELPQDDSGKVKVTLFGDGTTPDARIYDVIEPEGMDHPTAWWAEEITHRQFQNDVGYAIVHSKVLVVDAFGDAPVVVTGSHNFSVSASTDNDENFVVIRGDRALAEAFAVNVENAWRHYSVRAGTAHATLKGIDYLGAVLADQRREERFWHLV
jgi:phosphatidylserine/phosphatidylglycerophosphate/cardiolipin synthase-like enzyme